MTDLIWYVHQWVISSAFALLPGQMNTRESRAMMLAIGLHESGFRARVQGGQVRYDKVIRGSGPARGFWQFERAGGVAEILTSPDTKDLVEPICRMMLYEATPAAVHPALADNDVLAAIFCRLLLWRDPRPMPTPNEQEKGYKIYLRNWRPNPEAAARHAGAWSRNFDEAWALVKGETL